MIVNTRIFNDLDNYSLLDHTHSNYVTSSEVSSIVNTSIQNGEITVSSSVIRKITRGTGTATTSGVAISCSITNVDKVIVLLNSDILMSYDTWSSGAYFAAGGSVYLKSVSDTGITVIGKGPSDSGGSKSITFSYQIIEFM